MLHRIRQDYAQIKFREGKKFAYRPPRTVIYTKWHEETGEKRVEMGEGCVETGENTSEAEQNWYFLQLLHELGHALSGHRDFRTDVERVRMEREAWERARVLSDKYGVAYDEEQVEVAMDSYRDWLHQRSKCPRCGQTRYQGADGRYRCVFCETFGVK